MKPDIHPTYYPQAKVKCVCGAEYAVGSTLKEAQVEVCAACHPFYTGKGRFVDVAGRVDRFKERQAKKTALAAVRGGKQARKAKEAIRRERRSKKIENA